MILVITAKSQDILQEIAENKLVIVPEQMVDVLFVMKEGIRK